MWDYRLLSRIDFRFIIIIFCLMFISLLVISSMTIEENQTFFDSVYVKNQIQWFVLGWGVFLFFAGFDYRKYSSWSLILYGAIIFLLLGLYLTKPIQSVQRWYRIPIIGMGLQPSEAAKLILVISLAWFLEKKEKVITSFSSSVQIMLIIGIPFILILKQPDLGTALVLFPIAFSMCYLAGVNKKLLNFIGLVVLVGIVLVGLIFSGGLSHEKSRPFFTTFMKPYQYERLNPNMYHQKAAQTSIAIGGVFGYGWQKGEFAKRKWLPASHTDSVFAAYCEEFGLVGVCFLLSLFFALIYLSFQVVITAKDKFGRLLAAGIAVYLAMHIIVNIAMMCGFLPISGVPLLLITYGGSSVLTTMLALGILQSIYTRRFMFS